MRAPKTTRSTARLIAPLALAMTLLMAAPAQVTAAGFEDSRAADGLAGALDVVMIRPLATLRVVIGAGLFVPALFFSLPMGREGFDGAYDVLIDAPTEFAFRRKIGDF